MKSDTMKVWAIIIIIVGVIAGIIAGFAFGITTYHSLLREETAYNFSIMLTVISSSAVLSLLLFAMAGIAEPLEGIQKTLKNSDALHTDFDFLLRKGEPTSDKSEQVKPVTIPSAPLPDNMIYCPSCGQSQSSDRKCCMYCGEKFKR